MAEEHFVSSGTATRPLLIDAPEAHTPADAATLAGALEQDHRVRVRCRDRCPSGWRSTVENTYLSTFQAPRRVRLLLGTISSPAIILRNVLERRRELALLRAIAATAPHDGWWFRGSGPVARRRPGRRRRLRGACGQLPRGSDAARDACRPGARRSVARRRGRGAALVDGSTRAALSGNMLEALRAGVVGLGLSAGVFGPPADRCVTCVHRATIKKLILTDAPILSVASSPSAAPDTSWCGRGGPGVTSPWRRPGWRRNGPPLGRKKIWEQALARTLVNHHEGERLHHVPLGLLDGSAIAAGR